MLVDLGAGPVGQTVALVLAQDPAPPPGKGEEFGKASPIGLVVIVLLLIATVFLVRSMTKHLRRVPASFDQPATGTPPDAASPQPGGRPTRPRGPQADGARRRARTSTPSAALSRAPAGVSDESGAMPNRLAGATSPYLLQHADNPVDWWEWSDEAFEEAARRDVPVLLSVGYAACHWCHVMAHESFEDAATAAQMNAGFVAVKVDREERPDIDAVYMAATQAMTGQGGWPMTCFLTPAGEPFHCGTYYPTAPASAACSTP